MNKKMIIALLAPLFVAPAAYAQFEHHKGPIDSCVKSALDAHPGDIVTMRAEIEDGKPQYELDIHGKDGKHWEVECDAASGKIIETEREVAVDDPEFTSKAKVRLDAALKTALDKYPGSLMKIEYEIEADNGVAYEFDIKTADGKLLEVEVDAINGKLSDPEEVVYQIGLD
ncbi:PepSY domain-containing protein [Methylotuvimicrobium sp. KM2]|uniref:PepSY domain-containing protein n=1 Tax=Methylotuvimicrobium sp. KM2 TaxID=3133976 RepID=UPI0031010D8B